MPDSRRVLAVVHIDGNGIGDLFRKAGELGVTRPLSSGMNTAMVKAARHAVRAVLLPAAYPEDSTPQIVPARPVVLGGDDLTLLVRGDLAPDFIQEFATAYETETAALLDEMGDDGKELSGHLQDNLGTPHPTVKAGAALIGVRQPFFRAYRLAEALTGIAGADGKDKSRAAFWRVTGSHIPETREELEQLTRKNNRSIWRSSWLIGDATGAPTLGDLLALREKMIEADTGQGALREVAEYWLDHEERARMRQERAITVLEQRKEGAGEALDAAIERAKGGDGNYTPLLDAHNLAQAGSK